jgi:hypothetical protein
MYAALARLPVAMSDHEKYRIVYGHQSLYER